MDTEMINDKVSQGIMLISAEKYDAAKKVFEEIILRHIISPEGESIATPVFSFPGSTAKIYVFSVI